MKMKIKSLIMRILPENKFNFFLISLIVVGVICGAVYYNLLSQKEIELVGKNLSDFFSSVNDGKINYIQNSINSFTSSIALVLVIFILSFSIIGIPIVIFLVFMKGLTLGFIISSLLSVFGYKGSIYSFLYIFPAHLFSIFNFLLISFYSINFSFMLVKGIFKRKNIDMLREVKKMGVILLINFVVVILYSVCEGYLFPLILKWVMKII